MGIAKDQKKKLKKMGYKILKEYKKENSSHWRVVVQNKDGYKKNFDSTFVKRKFFFCKH